MTRTGSITWAGEEGLPVCYVSYLEWMVIFNVRTMMQCQKLFNPLAA